MTAYADCEPLLSDQQLLEIEERIRARYRKLPDDTVFVTAIVEPPEPNEPEFHFILISRHPQVPGTDVRTVSRGFLSEWNREKVTRSHYVATGVPLELWAFGQMAREHIEKLENLAAMMPT